MFQKLLNIFRIPDLRNKLIFTVALLCVYRIGFYVPLPGMDAPAMSLARAQGGARSAFDALADYASVFSGGNLAQGTIFGLGIMPYISASIIIQLLGTVVPALEKLKKEGEPGIRKINEWTRYLAVGVCIIQAYMYLQHFMGSDVDLYQAVRSGESYHAFFWVLAMVMLTAGSIFLMWLGEQIDQFGIGNGVSLIITAGIVSRIPVAASDVIKNVLKDDYNKYSGFALVRQFFADLFSMDSNRIGILQIVFLVVCFVFIVGASIFLTQAQRRIPVQQAKHMRGRRVYGGQRQYLPLRVNHSGVMPIIFAGTLISLPMIGMQKLSELGGNSGTWWAVSAHWIREQFNAGDFLYEITYCAMIFFFSYFWNTVQFQPKEMANQLRDYGSFIPGLRPGKRTADYLENVMSRITYVGAAFLCVIAIIPTIVSMLVLRNAMGDSAQTQQITQFLGGTGLLIVISVMLDFVNRIEANLVMRNYGGFLDDEGEGPSKVKRTKGGPKSPSSPRQPEPAYRSDNTRGLPA